MSEVAREIEALAGMSVARLRERYLEVFGEASRSGNRRWLYRRVAWRVQELALGGLSERARRRAAELARDADIRARPPRVLGGEGSPTAAAPRRASARVAGDPRRPAPGTVLTRGYKGVAHRVLVLAGGFEHEGRVYRSLSAVATAITGSHWNGFLFFGLAAKEGA